jgi:high-affinity nickel-transport protein
VPAGHDRRRVHDFAYSWAFLNPVRKVYYNLAITGLSVSICFFIGTIEMIGLLPSELGGLHGGFWTYLDNFDINKAGFVIVGMFIVCRAIALAFWRLGHVEERWSARLQAGPVAADGADVSVSG